MKYPPQQYQENNFANIVQLLKMYPFGSLISVKNNQPYITHLPLIFEAGGSKHGKLIGHIDANNPHTELLFNGAIATLVFNGPNSYMSPSIFSTPLLPTWNYIIAHIKGTVKIITDPSALKKSLVSMTTFLESKQTTYFLNENDPKMDALLNYIVGYEIEILEWEGKFKLSQDKTTKIQEIAKHELITSQQKNVTSFVSSIYNNHLPKSK